MASWGDLVEPPEVAVVLGGREGRNGWGVTVLSNTAALVFSVFHMGFYIRFQGQRALRLNQILGNHLSGRSPFFRACDSEELAVNYG